MRRSTPGLCDDPRLGYATIHAWAMRRSTPGLCDDPRLGYATIQALATTCGLRHHLRTRERVSKSADPAGRGLRAGRDLPSAPTSDRSGNPLHPTRPDLRGHNASQAPPRKPKHGPLGAVPWRAPQTLPPPTVVERSGKNTTRRSDRGFKTPESGEGGAWWGRHVEVEQADAEGSRAGNP
jgi:hypothetical protein